MTRLLATWGDRELLRAALPLHLAGAPALVEAISLCLGLPIDVVLCVDDQGTSYELGLCDGFGFGRKTAHYEVEVVDPRRRRQGLGSFRDLRQLGLRGGR